MVGDSLIKCLMYADDVGLSTLKTISALCLKYTKLHKVDYIKPLEQMSVFVLIDC